MASKFLNYGGVSLEGCYGSCCGGVCFGDGCGEGCGVTNPLIYWMRTWDSWGGLISMALTEMQMRIR